MPGYLVALVDCNQIVGRTQTSKLHSLFSKLTDEDRLWIYFLVSSEQSQENYQQLSKDLKDLTYQELVIQADSNPELLFLAKRHIDDKDYDNILILSSANFISSWRALCSILLTASAYKINFESLDMEQINKIDVDLKAVENDCHRMLMNIDTEEPVKILRSDIIPEDIFYHGFSTRLGGVSSIKTLKSLNLHYTSAKRDPKIVIAENIRRLAKAGGFRPESLQVAKVDHGDAVWEIGTSQPERYDAVLTCESNITLAAPGADCLIILFSDSVSKMCAAAHSGWKGTILQVAKTVVQKMVEKGSNPKNIRVAIGPGIKGCCMTIPSEYIPMFENLDSSCLVPKKDSKNVGVDLFKANRCILEENGILPENIDTETQSLCTVCNWELFYSHRRDRIPFGNQVGYIGLRK